VDLKNISEIKGEELHSKCGWTPFEKFGGIFPDYVYLRGEMILQDREVVSSSSGEFLNGKNSEKRVAEERMRELFKLATNDKNQRTSREEIRAHLPLLNEVQDESS